MSGLKIVVMPAIGPSPLIGACTARTAVFHQNSYLKIFPLTYYLYSSSRLNSPDSVYVWTWTGRHAPSLP